MVKQFFRDRSREWIDKPEWPEPRPNPSRTFRLPVSKAIAPTAEEIRTNPRARSAKLRVAELLDPKHP
jgi:16S rRNA (cytosine1402-N4)-methyltransferase